MSKRRPMSKAETEVARVLWDCGRATARDVWAALTKRRRKIDFTTVQTYLHRLEEKGYVSSLFEGRVKHFIAKVSPSNVIREKVDDFVKQLFDGNAFPLLQHLIQVRGLTDADLEKLRGLIDEAQQEHHE